MRMLGLAAAIVLLSTTAQARDVFEFRIGGGVARIEMGDCGRGPCPSVSWNKLSEKRDGPSASKYNDDEDDDKGGSYRDSKKKTPYSRTAKGPAKPQNDQDDDDDRDAGEDD